MHAKLKRLWSKPDHFDPGCAGCEISQRRRSVPGGVILELPGDWTANQYNNSEAFLGWIALQPRFHRMSFAQLEKKELCSLGPNIRALDKCLTEYWQNTFASDPLRRVYVVYFFEQEFERPTPSARFHLHLHIIPRPQSFDTPNRLQRTESGATWVDGWRVPELARKSAVPPEYARNATWQTKAEKLMRHLSQELRA